MNIPLLQFFAGLLAKQRPLGREFEAAIFTDIEELYEE